MELRDAEERRRREEFARNREATEQALRQQAASTRAQIDEVRDEIRALNGRIEELEHGFKGIILMDIMMPHMDGWTTIRQIVTKGLDKGNIISMVSAKDECDWKLNDLKQYVKNYITKPFDNRQLLQIVKSYFMTPA